MSANEIESLSVYNPILIYCCITTSFYTSNMFKQSTNQYQEALYKSGYKHKLEFNPPREKVRRKRSSKIVYYNQPYSQNVLKNIGKEFFKLIGQHFPVTQCP